jgi:Transposase DDE domain
LAPSALSATHALELYRGRWQIELVFKQLKSILSLGYLRKVDPDSARSWLEGKLLSRC